MKRCCTIRDSRIHGKWLRRISVNTIHFVSGAREVALAWNPGSRAEGLEARFPPQGKPWCAGRNRRRETAERTLASIQDWIGKHLRLKVNAAKSGTGRVWERKFLGFQLNRKLQIGIAPESIERLKAKVRELW